MTMSLAEIVNVLSCFFCQCKLIVVLMLNAPGTLGVTLVDTGVAESAQ